MTHQEMFGGPWTQKKLEALSKYLAAYRKIFSTNPRAQFFKTTYVDAFAGTGEIPVPENPMLRLILPDDVEGEEEFRKGSARLALEVQPPFDHYVFIEKKAAKCEELEGLKGEFPDLDVKVIKGDANEELKEWCAGMNTRKERAVVFLDPFGAQVDWAVIETIAATKAIDFWLLFPYHAINRMLVSDAKPSQAWAHRLTRVFGTNSWEEEFYGSFTQRSIIGPEESFEVIYKDADKFKVTQFFVARLKAIFAEVAEPGYLYNSKGLLFVLLFAAGNARGAPPALNIANSLIKKLNES
ncbi:MAG: three-Cys-motif partner protein TcmP [Candidatus Korobacteraceae bacterium]